MIESWNLRWMRGLLVAAGSLVPLVGGVIALLAYAAGWRELVTVLPGWQPIAPLTVLLLMGAAVALWLLAPPVAPRWRRIMGRVVAVVVFVGAGLALAGRTTFRDLTASNTLFRRTVSAWLPGVHPGRPTLYGCVTLLLVAGALLVLDTDVRGGRRLAQLLPSAAAAVVCVAGFSELIGLAPAGLRSSSGIPAGTVIGVLPLAVAVVACRPDGLAMRVLTSHDLGGRAARRLVPVVIGVFFAVGVLVMIADRAGLPLAGAVVILAVSALLTTSYAVLLSVGRMLNSAGRQQRHLATELQEQQDFSQTVLGALVEGVVAVGADGRIVHVNRRWCEITGYPAQDVLGATPPYPWWPPEPDAVQARLRDLDAVRASRTPGEFDTDIVRADGIRVRVLATTYPICDAGSRVPRMVVTTYRDLTERLAAEAERRDMSEQLDRFFELSQDLMCIANSQGYFTSVNPAWERLLGHPVEDLLNRPFLEFVHPDDAESTVPRL